MILLFYAFCIFNFFNNVLGNKLNKRIRHGRTCEESISTRGFINDDVSTKLVRDGDSCHFKIKAKLKMIRKKFRVKKARSRGRVGFGMEFFRDLLIWARSKNPENPEIPGIGIVIWKSRKNRENLEIPVIGIVIWKLRTRVKNPGFPKSLGSGFFRGMGYSEKKPPLIPRYLI